jgi:hypothetical protein
MRVLWLQKLQQNRQMLEKNETTKTSNEIGTSDETKTFDMIENFVDGAFFEHTGPTPHSFFRTPSYEVRIAFYRLAKI